jgi:TatD DNase family protein
MLIDTHCHLAHGKLFSQIEQLLADAQDQDVRGVICAAGDLHESKTALGLTRKYANVYCMAGIHPHEARNADDKALEQVADLAGKSKVVAVGEIGLDFHYDFSPRQDQAEAFAAQLAIAARLEMPVVIHTREAFAETLEILDASAVDPRRVLMHSFTGGPDEAKQVLDRGATISFSGIATFRNAPQIRQAAEITPDDRILVETDAPFLSPEPVRKVHPNVPAHVVHTARRLAQVRGLEEQAFARMTTDNAVALFNLDAEALAGS